MPRLVLAAALILAFAAALLTLPAAGRPAAFLASAPATPATPVAAASPVADPACAGVPAFTAELDRLLAPVAPVLEQVDLVSSGAAVDPATLRSGATALITAAGEAQALPAPPVAAGVPTQVAVALGTMGDGVVALANAVEDGDTAATAGIVAIIYGAAFELTGGAFADLSAACPTLVTPQ